MQNNWTISRRRFLGFTGTFATGLLFSPDLLAKSGEKPVVRFGMLSDVHYADREPAGERFYRQSLGKVQECIDRMNQEKLDFVIELGDFKDQDSVPNEVKTLKYLSDIETVFQQFNGSTYHVLGNHDMDSISKLQFLGRVENTAVPATESYYSFNRKGIHFVVLDGNFTSEGKEYDHGNFSWDDAFISGSQVNWLNDDLKTNKLPVIVFIHQMLDDSKSVKQAVQNAGEVRQILEQSGRVLCVFQGHVHEERYNLINGIHYCSVNAVVDGDGPDNNAYMVVDIYKDGSLKIDGYRRATDREMKK
ncbi:MAG: metallophosphoesterase [Bacteroidota bacterium]|nr:metallophosphoesterase [Bacteroidota bacterium]